MMIVAVPHLDDTAAGMDWNILAQRVAMSMLTGPASVDAISRYAKCIIGLQLLCIHLTFKWDRLLQP
jgi:hypothetical protein